MGTTLSGLQDDPHKVDLEVCRVGRTERAHESMLLRPWTVPGQNSPTRVTAAAAEADAHLARP
eukprot:scaffold8956_cov31-Phaeocystis_antarctica.AAC.3